jgi:membrane protease subunit (stomatin/prohibitin family)
MEEAQQAAVPQPSQPPATAVCPQCHQSVLPTYYFCPNCGKNLKEPSLSTSISTQTGIYLLSIIMPAIAFLAIKYWPGMKYLRSPDWEKKQIGIVAIILMAVSTIVLVWWGIVWTEGYIQSITSGLIPGL